MEEEGLMLIDRKPCNCILDWTVIVGVSAHRSICCYNSGEERHIASCDLSALRNNAVAPLSCSLPVAAWALQPTAQSISKSRSPWSQCDRCTFLDCRLALHGQKESCCMALSL